MSQQELMKRVVEFLDEAGIEFMITGSIASSIQGEPRSTHDIDIIVEIEAVDAAHFIKAFPPPDYYLAEEAIHGAVRTNSMFNLIDVMNGDKVDFWILTDSLFDRSRFSRRHREEFQGIRLSLPTPEDTILAKLHWAKLSGGSEKQMTDALRVYELQGSVLDEKYLTEWAERLEVSELLVSIKERILVSQSR